MNYKFKTNPYAHQIKALEKSWNKEVYALFMEMGTGKSKVLIDNISMLYDRGKITGACYLDSLYVYAAGNFVAAGSLWRLCQRYPAVVGDLGNTVTFS